MPPAAARPKHFAADPIQPLSAEYPWRGGRFEFDHYVLAMEWSSTICVQTRLLPSVSVQILINNNLKKKQDDALKNGEVLSYIVYQTCPNMDDQALVNREFSVVVLTPTHQVLRRHHQCCSIGSR